MEASVDAKRSALDAVLASRAFDRSDQLKRFLRYVCEMELAGQGQELTEYRIGVEALGRPQNFSPADDSIVRNRAYAVRKKLDEYYASEAPEAPVRIVLPKGNYVPRFAEAEVHPHPVPARIRHSRAYLPVVAALLLGALLASTAWWWITRDRLRPAPDPMLRSAWGDLLRPGQTVLVSVATPAQAFLREFPEANPPVPGLHHVTPSIEDWYRRQRNLPAGEVLLQVPTFNSPLWGDAAGAVRAASTLRTYGVAADLMAERLVTPPIFRNRNVIFFGSPEYSPALARLMKGLPLQVGFDRVARDHIAWAANPDGNVMQRYPPARDPSTQHLIEVYGLVTVLPSEGDGEQRSRYVIFSGISSAGTEAAAEYFVSLPHLRELAAKMNLRPGDPWPKRYQVLIHATTNLTVALGFRYETHRIW